MMKYFFILLISASSWAGLVPDHEQQIQLNLSQGMLQLVQANQQIVTRMFNYIWNDSTVAPCQVWTDINVAAVHRGTTAVAVRQSFISLLTLFNTASPGSIPLAEPAGYTMVENGDGTVTCTAPPAPSPSPSSGP